MIDGLGAASRRPAWSVGALVREVGDLLAGRFSVCTVGGEISGFSRAASGHCYFNLKDAEGSGAVLRCAMFRRAASLLLVVPTDGQLVEVRGRLGVYEPRGELQLVVEAMQGVGAGALYEQFLRIRDRLGLLGLFDAARKRPVPQYPRAIGIVTSLGAAALQDVLSALERRAPHVSVVLYPSAVQGPGAPTALAAAIATASRRAEVDVLIVCRGGGSLEDLWAFNDELVVRAIVEATMPVVCGVGHETDVSLADLAADLRAPTPTAAAELVAPLRTACSSVLDAIAALLRRRVRGTLDTHAQRLDRSAMRLARPGQPVRDQAERLALLAYRLATQPVLAVQSRQARLMQLDVRLRSAVDARVAALGQRLDAIAARLGANDPQRVLARGYVWLSDASDRPVASTTQLAPGVRLRAVLHDGTADVVVTDVHGHTSR